MLRILIAALLFIAATIAHAQLSMTGIGPAGSGVIAPGALLLEDNVSVLLLEDNVSQFCLEGGC